MSTGIDIGKYSTKIVELSLTKDEVSVKKIGNLHIFEDINKFDLEKISRSQLEASVQDLSKKLGINPRKVRKITSSISGTLVDVRQISTLDMPDEELSVSLELEAKKHIPLDGTDAIIDYHHLGSNTTEIDKINLLLVSTTKNIIKDHAKMIKNAGFRADTFDTDPIAIANMYKYNYGLTPEGADVILNIGNSNTTLIVWGQNFPLFARNIETSGNYFTNEIIRELGVDYKTAENLKSEKGVNVFAEDNASNDDEDNPKEPSSENQTTNFGISVEKRTCYSELCEDIKRTLRFYMKNNNQAFFNHFYVTGGSAEIPGINDFISSSLNVKVSTFNPFQKISNDIEIKNPNQYTTALGLALRGLDLE
ncbi:MAG: hypothetical protein CMG66_03295 [Candidatus Marinimicrobia bacterium]|nr:hypothetical protein [Candidatus Neomarinimicrobiota bacterium]|tara:strand:+ start:28087 stop:29181 length:1095 start_codon:yes stop_codon:yes gene_type:complete